MKRSGLVKVILAITLIVFLAAVLGIGFLHTAPGRKRVLSWLQDYLFANQGIRLETEELRYNLFELAVTLREARLSSRGSPDLAPILTADRMYVDLSMMSLLLKGFLAIEEARIDSPEVQVVILKDGRSNIPISEQDVEEEAGGMPDFLIESLRLEKGSFSFTDHQSGLRARLGNFNISIDGDLATLNHDIQMSASGGTVEQGNRGIPIRNLTLRADLPSNLGKVTIRDFKLDNPDASIHVSGTVDDLGDPRLGLKISADAALAPLSKLADLSPPLAGRVHWDGEARNGLQDLQITGRVTGDNVSFRSLNQVDLSSRVLWDMARQRLILSGLSVESPEAALRGEASLSTQETGQNSASLDVARVDLERLMRGLNLGVRVASEAKGRVEASWASENLDAANVRADLQFARSRSRAFRDTLPLAGSVDVRKEGGQAQIRVRRAETMGAGVEADIRLSSLSNLTENPNGRLSGRINAQVSDLLRLTSGLARFLGEQVPLLGTEVAGTATMDARLGGTLQQPAVKAEVRAPSTRVGNLQDVSLELAADYMRDRLEIERGLVAWATEQIQIGGTVSRLQSENPALDLNARLDDGSIESVFLALGKPAPVSGRFRLLAVAEGTVNDPQVKADIEASQLQAYGEALGTLTAEATLQNRVLVSRLALERPSNRGRLNLQAQYGLDNESYEFRAEAPRFELTSLEVGERVLAGVLSLTATGKGTLSNPAGSLQLNGEDLRYGEDTLGNLEASADVQNRQAAVKAAAPRFNFELDGTVGVDDPHPVEFTAKFEGTDLSLLPLPTSNAPAGNLQAEVTGEGALRDLKNATVTARMQNLSLTARGQTIQNDGTMSIGYANGRVSLESVKLTSGQSSLEIRGSVPVDPDTEPGTVTLAANIDLQTVTALLPEGSQIRAQGSLTADGTVTGNLQELAPNVNLRLQDAAVEVPQLRVPVTGVSLTARVEPDEAVIESLQARIGQAAINAQATLPYGLLPPNVPLKKSDGPARVTAGLRDFDLRSIAAVPEKMQGKLSVELQAEAPSADLQSLRGTARFPELALTMEGLEMTQAAPTTISLNDGRATIDQLRLTGDGATLEATGSMALVEPGDLNIRASGRINPAIIELFAEDVNVEGETSFELAATGTRTRPAVDGFLELNGVQMQIEEPDVRVTELQGRLNFNANRVAVERLTGTLNGGTLEASGGLAYGPEGLREVSVDVNARDFFMEYPEGLQLGATAELRLRSAEQNELLLTGRVGIREGAYTRSFGIWTELLNQFQSEESVDLVQEQEPALAKLNLNIEVDTEQPIVFDNNLAEVLLVTDLRLTGTLDRPGLTGRVSIEEGGEIHLRERDYVIERGMVTFVDENRIEPVLDVEARTEVGDNEITLQLTGPADDLEANFSSNNPPLPEPDIISLLVTGRTLADLRGRETEVAKEQALSLLSGGVARRLGSGLEKATGLSQVRIEPELISAESDPGARLTIGQDISKDLELIYSMNLIDSSDQIYIGEYNVTKRFTARVSHHTSAKLSESDPNQNLYRFEFNHRLLLGGKPYSGEESEAAERKKREVAKVTFAGNPILPISVLADKFDVETGQDYNFFEIRKGLDRLTQLYREQNYLEARVRLQREERPDSVDINVEIQAGPKVNLAFQGLQPPGDLKKRVAEIWADGVFDAQRAEDAMQEIRAHLVAQSFFDAKASYEVSQPAGGAGKQVTFQVEPGNQYQEVRLRFPGANQIPAEDLKKFIDEADLDRQLFTDPDEVQETLNDFYTQRAFLEAEVKEIGYELDAKSGIATVVIPIEEGKLYRVAEFSFNGNNVFQDDELANVVTLRSGQPYDIARVQDSVRIIESVYRRKGYTDVEVGHAPKPDTDSGRITLEFNIKENRQKVVAEVLIKGQDKTSEHLIRNQIELKEGDLLNPEKLAESRMSLYDTGAFALVDIETAEINQDTGSEGNQQPVRLTVSVREVKPFEFRYGGSYDTERGVGAVGDIINRNSLGKARVLGFRGRFDQRAREARAYFTQPPLLYLPLETSLSAFGVREIDREADFTTDRLGVSIRQEALLKDHYILSYGYRFERTRTTGLLDGEDLFFNLAPLSVTLTRDTRDDLLDATEGAFASQALEYAPSLLGSELRYLKYYGQFFRYIALGRPREIPWVGVEKPRLVYAGAVRLGLAQGLGGQELIPGERFFAGGETTVRGFRRDALGPRNAIDRPAGGEAVFVLNNELRFPLFSIFDGVGFVDVGNVYPDWRDFDPFNVRASYGFGLRIRTPYVLIRADYGLKLSRRSGETPGAFFVSIGQAF